MKLFFFSSKSNNSVVTIIADTLNDAISILHSKIAMNEDTDDYLVMGNIKCYSGAYREVFVD